MLQDFLFHLAIQGADTEFCCAGQMHRTRDARVYGCHSAVRRVAIFRVTSDCRTCWRADPGKKQMNNPFYFSLTRRSRVQALPTRARNNDTWNRRRIVSNMRLFPASSATCGSKTCGCRGSGPTVRIGRVLHTSLSRAQHAHGVDFLDHNFE
jgi:hypothetical protein